MPDETDRSPMAGEPQSAHDAGETPGAGAPSSAPTKSDPFAKGYGSGMAKGRKEGAGQVLAALGFGSIEEAQSAIEAKQAEESNKQVEGERRLRQLERELNKVKGEAERYAKLADEARLDRLRAVALARGVGTGRQLDAFVAMHAHAVRWGADRSLEVYDGDTPIGKGLDEWVDECIADSPFLRAARNTGGAGSTIEPAHGPVAKSNTFDLHSILGVTKR